MSTDVTVVFLGVVNKINYSDVNCTEYELRRSPNQKLCRDIKIDHYWYLCTKSNTKTIVELMGIKLGTFGTEDSTMNSIPKSDLLLKMESVSNILRTNGINGDIGLQIAFIGDE